MPPHIIELTQTRTGQPAVIGQKRGADFWSSIDRQPVAAPQLYLTWTGLAGDQPTETRPKTEAEGGTGQVHGGNDKAVYAYAWDYHFPHWLAELGEIGMGGRSLGENLRVRGPDERTVHIGDVWSWGDALVEVSTIRTPCQTLELYYDGGKWRMVKRMTANGRCGWYLRVVRPGLVPTSGHIVVMERNVGAPTVAQAFAAKMGTAVSA